MRPDDDFGATLRAFRKRVTPGAAGIPPSLPRARRAPGLRRDELAGRAGISEEHLKRLEQGRRRPSAGVVDLLATALRLSGGEHHRLRTLAGFAAPARDDGLVPREVTPAARRMLDRLTDVPACVCDASWTVLDGNRRWNAFGCPAGVAAGRDRNMAWRVFTEAPTDIFRTAGQLAAVRASMVAGLRAAADRYRTDPELRALIDDLYARGGEFARLWNEPSPVAADDPDRLGVPDGAGGRTHFDKDVLTLTPGDLRVVVFTRP
ncbi:helix-turn-helix domain-containing protein [Jidongwangia harbinensis]|uniref:helix-turn-helix domain-containing protein n=1 Tax=Jidongwangia harbinensis TaxID=2878561 RepID=UPI001CD9E4B9|nr:helix-turn-helix transcriptional regulator [Jidongwangia harbinensis]MCA2213514.1 helix-turn-helix transcriptional regulator [Jidongwangia harbinensis]